MSKGIREGESKRLEKTKVSKAGKGRKQKSEEHAEKAENNSAREERMRHKD